MLPDLEVLVLDFACVFVCLLICVCNTRVEHFLYVYAGAVEQSAHSFKLTDTGQHNKLRMLKQRAGSMLHRS